jgi:hypothetical protein
MPEVVEIVELKEDTLLAYTEYVHSAEAAMTGTFLWSDETAKRRSQISEGKAIAELWSGNRPVDVPHGLIHDWIGAIGVPRTTGEKTIALLQDYDSHKNVYKPDVIDSRLLRREGDSFEIYLRLVKKKGVTAVLDTYHEVHYFSPEPNRWCCRSCTTRVCEVEHAGKSNEFIRPPNTGYGFLWRLFSFWRIEERGESVIVECRAISLTRNIPSALRWIIQPIVAKLPRDSLKSTLAATRRALLGDGSLGLSAPSDVRAEKGPVSGDEDNASDTNTAGNQEPGPGS